MAWTRPLTRPAPPLRALCRCRHGTYPQPDPLCRWSWIQVTSVCPVHFRRLPMDVKIRIMVNEGIRL